MSTSILRESGATLAVREHRGCAPAKIGEFARLKVAITATTNCICIISARVCTDVLRRLRSLDLDRAITHRHTHHSLVNRVTDGPAGGRIRAGMSGFFSRSEKVSHSERLRNLIVILFILIYFFIISQLYRCFVNKFIQMMC